MNAAAAGEKGAVLRREGLYSSRVIEWRRARDAGGLTGMGRPRGRPAADPRDAQIARLRKEKAKLEQELAKARFVVDDSGLLPFKRIGLVSICVLHDPQRICIFSTRVTREHASPISGRFCQDQIIEILHRDHHRRGPPHYVTAS
jgi:hypothetical protein